MRFSPTGSTFTRGRKLPARVCACPLRKRLRGTKIYWAERSAIYNSVMPIFEYICKDCGKNFEAIVYGAKETVCPGCSGSHLEQQLPRFAVGAEKTPSFSSGSGPCGSW